jgi:hypothetical protein
VVENPQGPQSDRVHSVLVLSLATFGTSSYVVQVRALSFARSDRSAQRLARVWERTGRTWKCASGTALLRSATWFCRSAPLERKT